MDRETLMLAKAFELLPKYGGFKTGALNQAMLLLRGEYRDLPDLLVAFEDYIAVRETGELVEEVATPTRTTRTGSGALRDRMEMLRGDEVLVNTFAYDGVDHEQWCEVVSFALGSAAVYPIKVRVPERGYGQYRHDEILGWRRPLLFHRMIRDVLIEDHLKRGESDPLFADLQRV